MRKPFGLSFVWQFPFFGFISSAAFSLDQGLSSPGILSQSSKLPNLLDVTLDDLKYGLEKGLFTSIDLVNAYHARINEVNNKLKAVTEFNPDAWEIAALLDAERTANKSRGQLHGIPILIKNNIATADKMNNTAGSYALLGARVKEDSTLAQKLRKAGAIILGKANLSQWANYRSTNSNSGWSSHGGQVIGPFYPNQDPSGSSSGSAVATTLGLSWAAIGTETDGSIIAPSDKNGIVGMKPTVGLTSRYGVIPISEHQDSPGPMARTVKDAAYLLQAISGVDPSDNYTLANPSGQHPPDYVASCTTSGLRNTRIGVPRNIFSSSTISGGKSQQQEFDKALNILKSAGATIVDPANFGNPASWLFTNPETAILNADFLTNLPSYLSSLQYNPNNITNLAELRDWTRKSPLEEYPRRNTGLWDAILDRQKFKNTDSRFWAAYLRAIDYASTNGLIGTIKREKLDAVVVPAMFASSWAATIGSPLITVPLGVHPDNTRILKSPGGGLVDTAPGIPFGIAFLGDKWSEGKLFGMAYAFEQRTKVRTKFKLRVSAKTELKDIIKNP